MAICEKIAHSLGFMMGMAGKNALSFFAITFIKSLLNIKSFLGIQLKQLKQGVNKLRNYFFLKHRNTPIWKNLVHVVTLY